MLTKLGKKILRIMFTGKGASSSSYNKPLPISSDPMSNTSPALIEGKAADGSTLYVNSVIAAGGTASFLSGSIIASGGSASVGVALGTGTTMPTENDYTIEHQLTGVELNVGTATTSLLSDSENSKYIICNDYPVTNITDHDIAVSEICYFIKMYTAANKGDASRTGNSYTYSFMIDRTLLDQPITIPAGEARIVRHAIELDVS